MIEARAQKGMIPVEEFLRRLAPGPKIRGDLQRARGRVGARRGDRDGAADFVRAGAGQGKIPPLTRSFTKLNWCDAAWRRTQPSRALRKPELMLNERDEIYWAIHDYFSEERVVASE